MRYLTDRKSIATLSFLFILLIHFSSTYAQTLSFPGAEGFGRFAKGARNVASPQVYKVTNLNNSGPGSFRDAVSVPGRIVVFAVGGIVNLTSEVAVAANTTIAGQTAPGTGIVFFGKRVTFTSSNNTICRYLRIRLGATGNSGKDASGISNGSDMIFDHMSFTWGMDEVFSINWDSKGASPDNITIQNSIIGQGLHRENHSAGGLMQTPDGGQVSLLRNLYISNKTRNPKVKGVNEFVNNVVYDWGNGNRLGDQMDFGWSGEAYIMGGSSGVSEVNIINNYFMSGPLTPPSEASPFSRGTGTFNLYGAGNYFDNNRNGVLDGTLVPYNNGSTGYPGIDPAGLKTTPFPYPKATPAQTAAQAYQWVIDSVGACYPRRDQVDSLLASEVASRGTRGLYAYRETDLPLTNGGLGIVSGGTAPLDSDNDGMPDAWEDSRGLNKNNSSDAVAFSTTLPQYLNIEVYINSLVSVVAAPPVQTSAPAPAVGSALEGFGNIILNWKGGANTTGYKLYLGTNPASLPFVADVSLSNSSYTFSNAVAKTTYYWRVDAIGSGGTTTGTVWSFRAVSPKGLVGNWRFDETSGSTVADFSNYQQHGTIANMPQAARVAGKFGNALQYNAPGTTSSVNVSHAEQLLLDQTSFTISLWVKLTAGSSNYNSAVAGDCYLIHKGQFTNPGGKWYGIQLRDSTLTFAIDDGAVKSSLAVSIKKATSFNIFNNNWTNIVAQRDTVTKMVSIYINGVQAGSKTYVPTTSVGTTTQLQIGNSAENKSFHDVMDDVRLYNYALSPSEITALLNGSAPALTSGALTNSKQMASEAVTKGLYVHPNPSSGSCTVSFNPEKEGLYVVGIYNLQGQLLQLVGRGEGAPGKAVTYQLNLSNFTEGVYLIQVTTPKGLLTQRLMVKK